MKNLGIPLLVLLALLSSWALISTLGRNDAVPTPSAVNSRPPAVAPARADLDEALEKGSEALKRSADREALTALDPWKDSDNEKVQAIRGAALVRLKDHAAAAQACLRVPEGKRSNDLCLQLAAIFEAQGNWDKARDQYQALRNRSLSNATKARVSLGLARVANAQKNAALAIASSLEAVNADSDNEECFYVLFRSGWRPKNHEELAEILEKGEARHGGKARYNFELGRLFTAIGKPDQALPRLEKSLSQQPDNGQVHWAIAEVLGQLKRGPEGLDHLEKAVRAKTQPPSGIHGPRVLFRAAMAAHRLGRLDTAFRFLRISVLQDRSLLAHDDGGTFAAVEKAIASRGSTEDALFMKAFALFLNGDFRAAHDRMDQVLPDLKDEALKADAQTLIEACARLIEDEAARKALQAEIDARSTAGSDGQGSGSRDPSGGATTVAPVKPEFAPMIAEIKKRARDGATDAQIQLACAVELQNYGDLAGAETVCRNAVRLAPGSGAAHQCLATIMKQMRRYPEAIRALDDAIRCEPRHAGFRIALSQVCTEAGDTFRGINEALEVVKLQPRAGEGYVALAQAYARANRAAEARTTVQQAYAKCDELSISARQALDSLKKQLGN